MFRLLRTMEPEAIATYGKKRLISAFRRAAREVPAYRTILNQHNVDYRQVRDTEQFTKCVPVIDKLSIFPRFDIEELCVGGSLRDMKLAMSSSGFSGVYSFGVTTEKNFRKGAEAIDAVLDYVFDISNKKTFLITCIPMGVKVDTGLVLSENSVRSDMALAIIKKFSHKFDQTLIISDPHFLKKIVEDGNAEKIDWQQFRISLISGEDWFSESFRSYLAYCTNLDLADPRGRFIGATMGLAELDLNLFHESRDTINIRRIVQEDAALRVAMFGTSCRAAPLIFHYYPHRLFLEALPPDSSEQELVFSMLSPTTLMPLLRYNSRDRGWVFPYRELERLLAQHGYADLTPELKLPLAAVGGRKDRFMEVSGERVYPEDVKQGLYEDFEVAALTTGYFRMNPSAGTMEVQLKRGVAVSDGLTGKFKAAMLKYVSADVPVTLYRYSDFPYGMELDYERKFQHI